MLSYPHKRINWFLFRFSYVFLIASYGGHNRAERVLQTNEYKSTFIKSVHSRWGAATRNRNNILTGIFLWPESKHEISRPYQNILHCCLSRLALICPSVFERYYFYSEQFGLFLCLLTCCSKQLKQNQACLVFIRPYKAYFICVKHSNIVFTVTAVSGTVIVLVKVFGEFESYPTFMAVPLWSLYIHVHTDGLRR